MAKKNLYENSSEWNGDDAFDVLKVQGIKMDAIDKALDDCSKNRKNLCALKATSIDYHNVKRWSKPLHKYRRYTNVKAVLQYVDQLPLKLEGIYTKSSSWDFNYEQGVLSSLGVKGDALDKAIFDCQKDGNHFCVIGNVSYLENNNKYYDESEHRYRFKTTAQAVVQGFKVR